MKRASAPQDLAASLGVAACQLAAFVRRGSRPLVVVPPEELRALLERYGGEPRLSAHHLPYLNTSDPQAAGHSSGTVLSAAPGSLELYCVVDSVQTKRPRPADNARVAEVSAEMHPKSHGARGDSRSASGDDRAQILDDEAAKSDHPEACVSLESASSSDVVDDAESSSGDDGA
jgi:hypothetical protein